jgi:anti-sigma factor RsiW
MTCREVVDFLMAYDSGELPPDQRRVFDEHIADCAPCRTYLATYRETVVAAKDAFDPDDVSPPPEELVDAILVARRRGEGR